VTNRLRRADANGSTARQVLGKSNGNGVRKMNDNILVEKSAKAGIASDREELIRQRAYELYLARDGGPGNEMQDWLQAEAEIIWKLTH
jgi:hypothetical protein